MMYLCIGSLKKATKPNPQVYQLKYCIALYVMHIELVRDYCLAKPAVTEGTPFGPEVIVFKVADKMFLLMGIDNTPPSINIKATPDNCITLREQYPCVQPGYHMNKTHWNTVVLDGSVGNNLITEWIDDSYNLIVDSLPRKVKAEFNL